MTDRKDATPMDEKWTKGPWEWSGLQLLGDCNDDSCSPVLIAHSDPFDPSDGDRALIAAAPDLYEALKVLASATITPTGEIVGLMREDFDRARAALRKALGDGR